MAVALKGEAMLLVPNVTNSHFVDEPVNGNSLGPFERVANLEPLGPADLGKETLVHGRYHRFAPALHASIFKRQHLNTANSLGKRDYDDGKGRPTTSAGTAAFPSDIASTLDPTELNPRFT